MRCPARVTWRRRRHDRGGEDPRGPGFAAGELLAEEGLFAGRVLLDERSAVLASRIDAGFLAEAGWDAGTWVLTLPAEHPLLGRTFCRAPGCQTTCAAATRVCLDCQRRLTAAGLDLEDVALLPPPQGKRWLGAGDGTCRVTGCPRPWVTSVQPLCPEHLGRQEQLGVSTADFTVRADTVALPSHGTCPVASCPRQLPGHDAVYCDAHLQRLRVLRRTGHHPDEAAWRMTEPPVPRAGQVSLAGLARQSPWRCCSACSSAPGRASRPIARSCGQSLTTRAPSRCHPWRDWTSRPSAARAMPVSCTR